MNAVTPSRVMSWTISCDIFMVERLHIPWCNHSVSTLNYSEYVELTVQGSSKKGGISKGGRGGYAESVKLGKWPVRFASMDPKLTFLAVIVFLTFLF